jgi:YD repeat-containing protein
MARIVQRSVTSFVAFVMVLQVSMAPARALAGSAVSRTARTTIVAAGPQAAPHHRPTLAEFPDELPSHLKIVHDDRRNHVVRKGVLATLVPTTIRPGPDVRSWGATGASSGGGGTPLSKRRASAAPAQRHIGGRTVPRPKGAVRSARDVTVGSIPSAGAKRWWFFDTDDLPGVGDYSVNVVNGNFMVRVRDLKLPNIGADLDFVRVYNSMSGHDVSNTDGGGVSVFGNGWTNSYDMHLARISDDSGTYLGMSVFKDDGTRLDYSDDGGMLTPSAGVYESLQSDGGTGYFFTYRNGKTVDFYGVSQPAAQAGLNGRPYRVYDRNRNNYITFNYYFVNNDESRWGNIARITAVSQDNRTVTLDFTTLNGTAQLYMLTYPDGNYVYYSMDTTNNNLTGATYPGDNNTSSSVVNTQVYGFTGTKLAYILKPRYWESCTPGTNCTPTTGGYMYVRYDSSGRVMNVHNNGVVNPALPDGVSGGQVVQSGRPSGFQLYRSHDYTYAPGQTTQTDTEGHTHVFTFDERNRITTVAQTAGSTTSSYSIGWDDNNNVISKTNAFGKATEFSYDWAGNVIAVGAPAVATLNQGTIRPTMTYSFDGYNNMTAYCDPNRSAQLGLNYPTGGFAKTDSLCPGGGPETVTFSYPSCAPFGEVAQIAMPQTNGTGTSTTTLTYGTGAHDCSTDNGLVTSVTRDEGVNGDGTQMLFTYTFSYDAAGNVTAYSRGTPSQTVHLYHDSMSHLTQVTDADGISSYRTYYPNGLVHSAKTAAQAASPGTEVTFTYDGDFNVTSITNHYGGAAGVTQKWYDGDDRLLEVQLPTDASDRYHPWLTRYLYDLTMGGQNTIATPADTRTFPSYGELFGAQTYLQSDSFVSAPGWRDTTGYQYDALNHLVARYIAQPGSDGTQLWNAYTATYSTTAPDVIAYQTDPTNTVAQYAYDDMVRLTGINYTVNGGVGNSDTANTPAKTYTYDADSRVMRLNQSDVGDLNYTYDVLGHVTSVQEPSGTPGGAYTMSYVFTPDGHRMSLSVAGPNLTINNMFKLTYRVDGTLQNTAVLFPGQGTYQNFRSYVTNAGRLTSMDDPVKTASFTNQYDAYGRLNKRIIPQATYTMTGFDPEGLPTGYSLTTASQGNSTISYTINARGDLTSQAVNGTNVFSFNGADGYMFGSSPSFTTNTFDPLNSAALQITKPLEGTALTEHHYVNFDQAGRESSWTYQYTPQNVGGGAYTVYDAENRLVSASAGNGFSYSWGPTGKMLVSNGETLHWDGDNLLFTTNGSGTVDDVKVGSLADYFPGSGLTVWDRDVNGREVGYHTSAGTSQLLAPPLPNQRYATGNVSTQVPFVSEAWQTLKADGTLAFSGDRVYDGDARQWFTRDHSPGSLDDPLTLKPYIYAHNNSEMGADPTGDDGSTGTGCGAPVCFTASNTNPGSTQIGPSLDTIVNLIGGIFHAIGHLFNFGGHRSAPPPPKPPVADMSDWDEEGLNALRAMDFTYKAGNAALETGNVVLVGAMTGGLGAEVVGGAEIATAGTEFVTASAVPEIPAVEGVYEFVGTGGLKYVGQSNNIARRILEHMRPGGHFEGGDLSTVRWTEVLGGKTAREVAEQLRINELGGVENLLNVRNPIGPLRQYLLPPL